jgi:hypothetical protein
MVQRNSPDRTGEKPGMEVVKIADVAYFVSEANAGV